MSRNELQHKRAPREARADGPVRSRLSRFRSFTLDSVKVAGRAIGMGVVGLTLACAGPLANNAVAGSKDKGAKTTKTTIVHPDKSGPKEAKKKEMKTEYIEISKLEEYREKFVEEYGTDYEKLSENKNGFFVYVAFEKPLFIDDGKKALRITGYVSHNEKKIDEGGNKAGGLGADIYDVSNWTGADGEAAPMVGAMAIDLDTLRAAYKEKTGKELKYIHVIVELGNDETVGEYVQLRAIAASSKEKVEKGIIEENMPGVVTGYAPKLGTVAENPSLIEYTVASKPKSDADVVAKNE